MLFKAKLITCAQTPYPEHSFTFASTPCTTQLLSVAQHQCPLYPTHILPFFSSVNLHLIGFLGKTATFSSGLIFKRLIQLE